MKRIVIAALAAAAWCAVLPAPARAQEMVTAQNPETVRALFATWGYGPSEMRDTDDQPSFLATVDNFTFAVAFNGCTAGRGCLYLVLIANYDDINNPPAEWLNHQNYQYDELTASRREDDGRLVLRTGITLGPEGIPVSTLRLAMDGWIQDTGAVERSAAEAGLVDNAEAADPPPAT